MNSGIDNFSVSSQFLLLSLRRNAEYCKAVDFTHDSNWTFPELEQSHWRG
jgi:hypothetical protein